MENGTIKLLDTIARGAAVYLIARTAYKLGKIVAKAEMAHNIDKAFKKYKVYVEEKES